MTIAVHSAAFLDEQTAGSLVRNSFRIFFSNFLLMWAIGALLIGPGYFVQLRGGLRGNPEMELLGFGLILLGSIPSYVAFAAAVSEACLGHRVSLKEALRISLSRSTWSVFCTSVLALAATAVGFLLLIVPGLVFLAWFMLAAQAAVIEKLGPVDAMRRSRELGKGFYLRNIAVFFLLLSISLVAASLLPFLVGAVLGFITGGETNAVVEVVIVASASATVALQAIPIILLYYDMRARKEGRLNATRLLEELRA